MRLAALVLAIATVTGVLVLNYSAGVDRLADDHAPGWSRQVKVGKTDRALAPAVAFRPDGGLRLAWSEFAALVTAAVTPDGGVQPGVRIPMDDPGLPCFAGDYIVTTAATPAGRRLAIVVPPHSLITGIPAEAAATTGADSDLRVVMSTGRGLEVRILPEGRLLEGAFLPLDGPARLSVAGGPDGCLHVAYAVPRQGTFGLGYWHVPVAGGPGTHVALGVARPSRQSFQGPAVSVADGVPTLLYSLQGLVGVQARLHRVVADGSHEALTATAGPLERPSSFLSQPHSAAGLIACVGEVTWTTRVQAYEAGFFRDGEQRVFVPVSRAQGACVSPRLTAAGGDFALAWLETAGPGSYSVSAASTGAGLRAATAGTAPGDRGRALGDTAAWVAAAFATLPLAVIWLVPGYMAALALLFILQDRVDAAALSCAAIPAGVHLLALTGAVAANLYTPAFRALAPPYLVWPGRSWPYRRSSAPWPPSRRCWLWGGGDGGCLRRTRCSPCSPVSWCSWSMAPP